MSLLDTLSGVCMIAGSCVGLIGAVGVLRFPDFFSRLHPAGMADTLCASLILFGLMLQATDLAVVAKLLLILFFLLFTTPAATMSLAKTAVQGGSPLPEEKGDA